MEAQMLREQAKQIRLSAQHAEHRDDAKAELNLAAELEARADQMEGKVKAPKGIHHTITPEAREAARRANFKRAFGELEAFFSRKGNED